MVTDVELFASDGGPQGLGFLRGTTPVNPEAWFFKAHFYQDPVWPGSLGLELDRRQTGLELGGGDDDGWQLQTSTSSFMPAYVGKASSRPPPAGWPMASASARAPLSRMLA